MESISDTLPQIFQIPPELFGRILSFLNYDEIATTARLVSRKFNESSKLLLNSGFSKVDRNHSMLMASVKGQLPRRESERRNHALARHNDILTAVETRISLMGMTFNKYIDAELCCFIPGKVLDELSTVLRNVKQCLVSGEQPARPHELLQELRDISSMAMEHFEERIAPLLRDSSEKSQSSPFSSIFGLPSLAAQAQNNLAMTASTASVFGNIVPYSVPSSGAKLTVLMKEVSKIKQKCSSQIQNMSAQKNEITGLKTEVLTLKKKVATQNRIIAEQNRKFEEFSRKYETLLAELRSEIRTPDCVLPQNSSQKRKMENEEANAEAPAMAEDSVPKKKRQRKKAPIAPSEFPRRQLRSASSKQGPSDVEQKKN